MSRSREAEVLILDTNPSLGTQLQAAKESFVLHVQQKLIQMPTKSEIGLVLLGAIDSNNRLASSGGYENVCEHKPISLVDTELVKNILGLNHGIDAGDWLDAFVVAMDMINRHCEGKKFEKSIIMITNGARPVLDEDQLTVIAETCLDMKIRFRLYLIDQFPPSSSVANAPPLDGVRNASLLNDFTSRVNGERFSINDLHKLKGALSRGSVSSQTVFRGILYVSPKSCDEKSLVGISVWAYAKTKQASLPSLKKRIRDSEGSNHADVGFERKYVHEDDNTEEVEFQYLIKAHGYGREDVPVSKDDADNIKQKADKEIIVLGYMKESEIGNEQLMGNADIVVPDKDCLVEMVHAFGAFAAALKKRGDVAIVRWVRRANDAPKLFTLWPGTEGTTVCLYAIRHPFCEDMRPCPLPSLNGNKKKASGMGSSMQAKVEHDQVKLASLKQDKLNEAAQKLILNADLEHSLDYRSEFNPVIQSFFVLVNQKVTGGTIVGASAVGSLFVPDWSKCDANMAADAIEQMASLVGGSTQDTDITIKDTESNGAKPGHEVAMKLEDGNDNKGALSGGTLLMVSQSQGDSIDLNDPIPRFERQWKEESMDAHDAAIANMMHVVDDLVKTSPGERLYKRALDCLVVVRDYCEKGRGDEADLFNEALKKLMLQYEERKDLTFCSFLRTGGMSLIPVRGCSSCLSASDTCNEVLKEVDDDGYDDAIMDAD
jgi:hypothetical protein